MSDLSPHIDRYLAVRRAVGYSLAEHGRLLARFVADLEADGVSTVTVEAALAWANKAGTAGQVARRLSAVRGFARYLHAFDSATEVPPRNLGPRPDPTPRPHVYSTAEVAALMTAASELRPELWAASFVTMIGLLAATGLRPAEAFRLERAHVDLDAGQLAVVHSKAGRSRQIPLHPSTVEALGRYRRLRDRTVGHQGTAFFVTGAGAPVCAARADTVFRRLRTAASLTVAAGERPARLYDFRHTFAVNTLLDWHRSGVDAERHLPRLSAYLGHLRPAHTYWYLHATPELMAVVADRLASTWEPQP